MSLTDEEIRLAKEFGQTPLEIRAILQVYEAISRFAGYSIHNVKDTIVEERYYFFKGNTAIPRFNYSYIPMALEAKVCEIIGATNDLKKYFSPQGRDQYLKGFVLKFIRLRLQPSAFLFHGILIPRCMKNNPAEIGEDHTAGQPIAVSTYQEDA